MPRCCGVIRLQGDPLCYFWSFSVVTEPDKRNISLKLTPKSSKLCTFWWIWHECITGTRETGFSYGSHSFPQRFLSLHSVCLCAQACVCVCVLVLVLVNKQSCFGIKYPWYWENNTTIFSSCAVAFTKMLPGNPELNWKVCYPWRFGSKKKKITVWSRLKTKTQINVVHSLLVLC